MNRKQAEHLAQVKLGLADKYERKARTCKSRPQKAIFLRRAEGYRRQAVAARRDV